ncbi:MAG TPA: hypothetical protein QF873_02585 [Patescibacteria group bacterium]|nr:hypothetical protein [Patescibacteria group bacterium]
MTITTHATLGAVIGVSTGNIWIAFFAGFISHFLIDIIPHGDRELYEGHKTKTAVKRAYRFVTIDALVAIIVLALMFGLSPHQGLNAVIAAGVIGSVLPDLIVGVHEAWNPKKLDLFSKVHFFFHNMISDRIGDVRLRNALIGQAVFIIALQKFF